MSMVVTVLDPIAQGEGLMRRWAEAWNSRDPEAFSWLVTSDVVLEDPMGEAEPICRRAEHSFRASPTA